MNPFTQAHLVPVRDHIAIKAMAAIIGKFPARSTIGIGDYGDIEKNKEVAEAIATSAYIYADALLAESLKPARTSSDIISSHRGSSGADGIGV